MVHKYTTPTEINYDRLDAMDHEGWEFGILYVHTEQINVMKILSTKE